MANVKQVQSIFIDVADAPCNAVALYWLDKNSAWDMWVFSGTQTEGVEVGAGEEFEKFIADLQGVASRSKYISKTETPKIILGYNNLPTNKVLGIKGVLSAIEVKMLTSGVGVLPPTFMSVKVLPGTFTTVETENGYHNLEFTIELPELFIQEN